MFKHWVTESIYNLLQRDKELARIEITAALNMDGGMEMRRCVQLACRASGVAATVSNSCIGVTVTLSGHGMT